MKYEFTGETKELSDGIVLRQIRLLRESLGQYSRGQLGGWIENELNLSQEDDSWVADEAMVFDNAKVYGSAKVYGNAKVYGAAEVFDNAKVFGNARVYGDAKVYGNADVFDNAKVYGSADVYGNAKVYWYAEVLQSAEVYGNAKVCGQSHISGQSKIYGNTMVTGDICVYGKAQLSLGVIPGGGSFRLSGDASIHGDAIVMASIPFANRSDGYTFSVSNTPDGPRVIAGCRYFTFEEAREHWITTRGGTRLGVETLLILDYLESMTQIRNM